MSDVEHYLSLRYTRVLKRDDEGDVVASIPELPGCVTHGSTEAEALENLREVQALWIEENLAAGLPVPEPAPEEPLPSGKWVQRVPRSLHQKLVAVAKLEGVSLNQFVTTVLSEAVGQRMESRKLRQDLVAHAAELFTRCWVTEEFDRPWQVVHAAHESTEYLPVLASMLPNAGKLSDEEDVEEYAHERRR